MSVSRALQDAAFRSNYASNPCPWCFAGEQISARQLAYTRSESHWLTHRYSSGGSRLNYDRGACPYCKEVITTEELTIDTSGSQSLPMASTPIPGRRCLHDSSRTSERLRPAR
jgi:hypothetical protein